MSKRVRIGAPSPARARQVMRTRVNSDDVDALDAPAEDDEDLGRAEVGDGRSSRSSLGEGPAEDFLRQQGAGRPIGAQSHMTRRLKDAIYAAGEEVGFDGRGAGGMQGYLKRLALHDVPSYVSLVRMLLPRQVYAQVEASSVVLEVLKVVGHGDQQRTNGHLDTMLTRRLNHLPRRVDA